VAMIVGALLLVAPGVFLLVCWLVLVPVILFERAGPIGALVRSVQLMRPLWWQAFAALVIAALLALIAAVLFIAVLAVVAEVFAGNDAAMKAILNAGVVGFYGFFAVFMSALQLALHSAASNSA